MQYYKIHSLWKREGWYFEQGKKNSPDYQKGRQSFIIGDYAEPEYACIKSWRVTEKVDGTNIRIFYQNGEQTIDKLPTLQIRGRTDNAQLPAHLLEFLQHKFTIEKMKEVFPDAQRVFLFGEGYGPKIQEPCGSLYSPHIGFALFDVMVGGWILKFDDVMGIAKGFSVPHVPDLGIMTTDQIVNYVEMQPESEFSMYDQTMEGIVAFPEPLMLHRNREPIKMKLKCKEFKCLV